jgi:hypothetical protein
LKEALAVKSKFNKRSHDDLEKEENDENETRPAKRELDESLLDENDQNPRKKFEQEDFDDWR